MAQGDGDELAVDGEYLLLDHEERITQNERHRLQVQGALKVLAFIIGSGAAVTLAMFII